MITTKTVRTFFVGMTLTFLMTVIPHLGFGQHQIISPLSKPAVDVLQNIKPQLELHPNNFQLKRQLIPFVSAGADYDQASAYVLIDADSGQIIAAKNSSSRLPMASLTKVMTAVVALDLVSPDEKLTISQQAARQTPTKVMLKPGEQYSLKNLLQYALISSANDSAQAIADGVDVKLGAGTFVKAMNEKARILGLVNTHFTNAPGLDNAGHYSSAEDLAVLSAYALKNYPLITQTVSYQTEDLTNNGGDMRFYLQNWNGLLGIYPGASGVKIGNTAKAGNCTIVSAERSGKKVIAVLLGAPGVLERDLWASELLDLGFNKVAGLSPVNVTEQQLKDKYAAWQYFQ